MLQRSFYLPEQLYLRLRTEAREKGLATAELIRRLLEDSLRIKREKEQKGTKFLLTLAKYNFRGGPKNLASKHDTYAWE